MTVMNLDQLDVWRLSRDFAVTIYQKIIPLLPPGEKYYFQDNVRFCYIARGSLTEVQSHLLLAKELGMIPPEIYTSATGEAESVARTINSWISYLKKAKTGINEPGANHSVHEPPAVYFTEDPTAKD